MADGEDRIVFSIRSRRRGRRQALADLTRKTSRETGQRNNVAMVKTKLPPLEAFNAEVVQKPLQGLLININRQMERQLKQAAQSGDREAERWLSLSLTMARVTFNSYQAICFLVSTTEEHPRRKKEFALVIPPANRQLFDLLFTLVYMMDDFRIRSIDYELSGYRQLRETFNRFHTRFGKNPKWRQWFKEQRETRRLMEKYLAISTRQKRNPQKIPYWQSPFRLKQKATKSQKFMQFLDEWLYGEISAQAHLNAAGLLEVGQFVLVSFAPEDIRHRIESRTIHQYTFRQFSRTLITVLAIATEIDTFCSLGYRTALANLWVLLGGWVEEAKDVYDQRYRAMLV
jgi:hypothetical protein